MKNTDKVWQDTLKTVLKREVSQAETIEIRNKLLDLGRLVLEANKETAEGGL